MAVLAFLGNVTEHMFVRRQAPNLSEQLDQIEKQDSCSERLAEIRLHTRGLSKLFKDRGSMFRELAGHDPLIPKEPVAPVCEVCSTCRLFDVPCPLCQLDA
jgi:hypothetical protein